MNSPCFLIRFSAHLFLALCLLGCANQVYAPQKYPVVDRPEFMDQALSQSELESASEKWVSDLTLKLRSTSRSPDGKMHLEEWLERQRIEIKEDIRDYEDGTLYNFEFNLRLARRMVKKLKSEN